VCSCAAADDGPGVGLGGELGQAGEDRGLHLGALLLRAYGCGAVEVPGDVRGAVEGA
jgi:hypothetical protein